MAESVVFCADMHLAPDEPEKTERFVRFLRSYEGRAQVVYLLGDLFDIWLGWRHLRLGEYKDVVEELRRLTKGGTQVFFIPGNRDFMVGRPFARETGVTIVVNGREIELGGRKVYVAHGDLLCTEDVSTQRFAAVMRGTLGRFILQPLWRILPVRVSYNLAHGYRNHSDRMKKFKARKAYHLAPAALKRIFERGCEVVICGHLHKPGKREIQFDGKTRTVFVLGDWSGDAVYLEYADGDFRLKTFLR